MDRARLIAEVVGSNPTEIFTTQEKLVGFYDSRNNRWGLRLKKNSFGFTTQEKNKIFGFCLIRAGRTLITMDLDERIAANTKICELKEEIERLQALLLQRNKQIKVLQAENFRIRNVCLTYQPR